MRRLRHRIALAVLAMAGLLGACSLMESERIDFGAGTGGAAGCSGALGWYALPRAYVRIRVGRVPGTADETDLFLPKAVYEQDKSREVEIVRHPDPALTFCLDYLQSATANDTIEVRKWPLDEPVRPPTPYLAAVMVNATDQTRRIAQYLARTFFILASGNPAFTTVRASAFEPSAPPIMLADLEFDPFDDRETAAANDALRRLGFCVLLENYSIDLPEGPARADAIDRYCNAPRSALAAPTSAAALYRAAVSTPVDPRVRGIFYRPRADYRLAIYQKRDPGGRGEWTLRSMQSYSLENLSPVVALALHRAAFAGKRINLIFDQGALVTACIAKTSEIAEAVNIPLEIARSIVDLPGQIVSVRIDRDKQRTALLEQRTLLAKLRYNEKLLAADNSLATSDPEKKLLTPGPGTPGNLVAKPPHPIYDDSGESKQFLAVPDAPDFTDEAFGSVGRVSIGNACRGARP